MTRWTFLTPLALAAGLAGCGPAIPDDVVGPGAPEPTSPAYAPDDPCKGVVPQLCPV